MSHLSDLGFTASREEFIEIAKLTESEGERIPTEDGDYVCRSFESNIEFWACLPKDDKKLGINPHFAGKTENKVRVEGVIESEYSNLENAYIVWINEKGINDVQEYPFIFDCPNFAMNDDLINKEVLVQVTAFVETEFTVFKDEEEFNKDKEIRDKFIGSHSFIPSGQFVDEGQKQRAQAVFAGEVKEVNKLKNTFTGNDFYWLIVNSLDADYDVVVGTDMVRTDIDVGNIIIGNFWMSGKVIKVL